MLICRDVIQKTIVPTSVVVDMVGATTRQRQTLSRKFRSIKTLILGMLIPVSVAQAKTMALIPAAKSQAWRDLVTTLIKTT